MIDSLRKVILKACGRPIHGILMVIATKTAPRVRRGLQPLGAARRANDEAPHLALMEVFRKLVSKKLSDLIVERGLEISQFLEKLRQKTGGKSVTDQAVRLWFRGESSPRIYLLPIIADALDVEDYRDLMPSPREILAAFSELSKAKA